LSRGQIQNCQPGHEKSDFAATSSKDDWGKRAKDMFRSKKYDQAKDSYMRADNYRMADVANAYVLRDIAEKMPNHLGTTKTRPAAFESAAQAFLACARYAQSGDDMYKDCHRLAAKYFEEAGNIIKAAENYRIAEKFTEAALLFRKSGKFDDVHDIFTNHSDNLDVASEDLKSVKDVTRLYFLREKKFQ
jgi:tetratricopeptide (TPR) repeat protein